MRGRRCLRSYLAAIKSSAGVRLADDWPTHAAASGSAAPGAAVRCEGVRRNCCNDPEARSPRAASGRAPDNPDSNTAPSNRADIAFVCLAKPRPRRRKEKRMPPKRPDCKNAKNWRGLCAGGPSESRQIYTISSGTVARLWKIHGTEKRRVRTLVLGPELLSIRLADEASARWKASLRADPLSSARRPLAAASLRARLFRHRCWLHHLCRRRSWACCSKSANRD
jgi:hypothetical protein